MPDPSPPTGPDSPEHRPGEPPPDDPPGRRADETVERRVDAAVDQQIEAALHDQVDERVEDAVQRAGRSVSEAERAAEVAERSAAGATGARTGAEAAASTAQRARSDAVAASQTAVEAARVVAPNDPVLDTAGRRIEAQVDLEHPFGRPGRPMSSRSPFRVAFTAAIGVAVAYALVQAVIAVRSVLILLLIAAFLAIGLNPAVELMERRGIRRSLAVGLVLFAALLFFTGFGFAVVPPILDQGQEFVATVPGYVTQLQDNERIAELDERFQFLDRARESLDQPEALGASLFGGVLGVGRVVFSAFFSTLTVLILTLYFLSSLPTIKSSAYRLVPRSRRARVGLLTDEILSRVGGYVAGALGIATLAGVSTFLLLMVLGVPYPLALAMLVAVTALIPLIGATIGAVVVVTVALFTSVQAGVICAVFYLVYQQVENYVVYPRVMQRSVDVSPAATVVAVLVGGSLLGVLGALLAIPLAAAVQLVLNEVVAPRQDTA